MVAVGLLGLAVGFSMVASYLLSSTFVPVMSAWLLRNRGRFASHGYRRGSAFERLKDAYGRSTRSLVGRRWVVVPAYLAASAVAIGVVGPTLGLELFPKVDAGRFQLRIKAPTGTRIEESEKVAVEVLGTIAEEVGRDKIDISLGYVGVIPSTYPINAIYQWTAGPKEVILRVALKPGANLPIEGLKARLRDTLTARMPGARFSFEPADIVSEVMSFGSPTPIEVAVTGPSLADDRAFAEKLRGELAKVESLRDLQYAQALDYPTVEVDVDRKRSGLAGLSVAEVARSLVAATSSSRFVVPNYWPDPKTGIGYQVQVEIPYARMDSIARMGTIPVQRSGSAPLLLRDVARITPGSMTGEYDRSNLKRTVSLTANIVGEDLGHVSGRVDRAIKAAGEPPKGVTVDVRGQVAPMKKILRGLAIGLGMAVIVILLLLTADFQSIRLALVVISTAPAVVAGVVLALRLSGTSINLQSFLGAIMAVGVAVANAILLVTFAEQHRLGASTGAVDAAVLGATGRLRPILITGLAMVAGMLPLALGWGEGGEQSASLGRAVIGGLAAATLATLFVLPTVFAIVQGGAGRSSASLDPFDPASARYVPGAADLTEVREVSPAMIPSIRKGFHDETD